MNAIRRVFGLVWILLGLAAGYFLVVLQSFTLFEKGDGQCGAGDYL